MEENLKDLKPKQLRRRLSQAQDKAAYLKNEVDDLTQRLAEANAARNAAIALVAVAEAALEQLREILEAAE